MGSVFSLTESLSDTLSSTLCLATEYIEEKRVDGTCIKPKRKNPWVVGCVVISSTVLIAIILDGGDGTLTKIFGRSGGNIQTPVVRKWV